MFILQLCGISAIVPPYLPPVNGLSRLKLILTYFDRGFPYNEILILLFVLHGFKLCSRQLIRILKQNNRHRRHQHSPDEQLVSHLLGELEYSGQCVGYRTMWQRLVINHKLRVPRDQVLRMMRLADPEGVAMRKAHRLGRRLYYASGPNYIWHVDGYDKLKPYGFCIHGCIDGYSRKILWLEVASSNNDPSLIASYYLDTLKELGVAPRLLRCDMGT
ncbi:MAG: hypothetical protein N0E48_26295, partial [Candidatus Thiodiazotropha endolucinida]|nr:hypothetical protein [Candidatus Thiodiazotropha endolucinida]